MDCSTIIVSYNTFSLTRVAVETALGAAPGLRHEVIVVDNASPDESARRLHETFATDRRVQVIDAGGNIGFSAANNRGVESASGECLFFLNPDTIVHGDAIRQLVDCLRASPSAGAVGPGVLNADGSHQQSTASFASVRSVLHHCVPLFDTRPNATDQPTPVDIVKGCALAMRRDVFDHVGGWDASIFMYAEENELCLALHRLGYTNLYVPDAIITHLGGAASLDRYAEQQVVASRSYVAFLKRHRSPAFVRFHRAASCVGYGARYAAFGLLATSRPTRAEAYRRRQEAAAAVWRWYAFGYD